MSPFLLVQVNQKFFALVACFLRFLFLCPVNGDKTLINVSVEVDNCNNRGSFPLLGVRVRAGMLSLFSYINIKFSSILLIQTCQWPLIQDILTPALIFRCKTYM